MSETATGVASAGSPERRPAGRGWQIGVRGQVLLIVAAALVASITANRRRLADLAPQIVQLRPVARRLEVDDPRRFAAVSDFPDYFGDETSDVHIPDGGGYRLCLATRRIGDREMPTPIRSTPIAPGRHHLTLSSRQFRPATRFVVHDGAERRLVVDVPGGWMTMMWGPASHRDDARMDGPADRPFVLVRRRLQRAGPPVPRAQTRPSAPSDEILLWVEPVDAIPPAPTPR